ncbi:MAG: EAL domain-containing protein [Erythrobacter sp.]|nr:EAL domain-containing protein [Erythrobacter sp.]
MRQCAIAVALAVAVAVVTILRPLDITFWALQSKLPGSDASGSIVLVTDDTDAASNSTAAANSLLLRTLQNLDKAEASRIVIDTPLRTSNDIVIDGRLRNAINAARDRTLIALPVDPEVPVAGLRHPNAALFADAAPIVSSDLETDFLDFVWEVEPTYSGPTSRYPSLWAVLAGKENVRGMVQPDYRLDPVDLPTVSITDLATGRASALEKVRGKQVVIASLGGDDRAFKVPNSTQDGLTSAHVSVIAAETALHHGGLTFSTFVTIPAFGLALLLLACAPLSNRSRRIGYAVWTSGFIVAFLGFAAFGHRVMLADALVIAFAYGAMRASANYRRRHLFVDAQSRLPNFTAFRRHLEAQGSLDNHVLVIVKIARLDAIFATLKGNEQGEYLRQVASRLSLGESSANVYHDGGKYLGMVFRRSDYADLQGHLEGLRAIASQAVMVEDTPIDVAITIGVDQSEDGDVANRISSAIAAADQAREAYRPVFIISDFQVDSEEWDHSLQSRLENALSENRISVKLQPKVDMQSGMFVGAEALARWTDQQRGEIPPVRFILQCERAGRLDDLTKRVMEKSMQAAKKLAAENLPSKVSVNVSAIQFVDSRIVDLVEMALSATGADPRNIMIEITETARVENLVRARSIMEEIRRLGIEFSIDDFGVGSGNLDALYGLPFDELKIDRMFANEVGRCDRARAVVASLLDLSRAFGMRSVVEGIDHLDTFEVLRDMGGDLAQGFCIARPQTLPLLCETLRLQATTQLRRFN